MDGGVCVPISSYLHGRHSKDRLNGENGNRTIFWGDGDGIDGFDGDGNFDSNGDINDRFASDDGIFGGDGDGKAGA